MSETNLIDIVKKLYACLPAGDWDTYAALTQPDFCVVEASSLPYAGVHQGMDGFMKLIEIVFGTFSEFDAQPAGYYQNGDTVMVDVNIRMTGRASGKTIDTQLIEVFRFKDGKLAEIKPYYFDSDLINSIV